MVRSSASIGGWGNHRLGARCFRNVPYLVAIGALDGAHVHEFMLPLGLVPAEGT